MAPGTPWPERQIRRVDWKVETPVAGYEQADDERRPPIPFEKEEQAAHQKAPQHPGRQAVGDGIVNEVQRGSRQPARHDLHVLEAPNRSRIGQISSASCAAKNSVPGWLI